MHIGFLLPATMAIGGRSNGIRAQAIYQMRALERLGHAVTPMHPWDEHDASAFDVIHFFLGGLATYSIERMRNTGIRMLSFAPIIDTNEPYGRYRLASRLGHAVPKMFTIPAVLADQANGSDLVVCRSTHEHGRMTKGLGIDPAKCRIVLNGVDQPPPANPQRARDQLGIQGDFLLHVSAYTQERKNTVRLARAALEANLPLVIAGSSTPGAIKDELVELERQNPGRIHLLDFLPRETLNDLYAACRVFCLPSVHEGTGLVALEAAAHGAGVVITKHGGPPDYFADLGYYVDHEDVPAIARALAAAWADPKSEALKAHVSTLTWDASARSLVEAFEARRPG